MGIKFEKWWLVILESFSVIREINIYTTFTCCSYLFSSILIPFIILFFYFIANKTRELTSYVSADNHVNFTKDFYNFYKAELLTHTFQNTKLSALYSRLVIIIFVKV